MDKERLIRIEKIVEAAILMDSGARTLFLDAVCQGDESLRSDRD